MTKKKKKSKFVRSCVKPISLKPRLKERIQPPVKTNSTQKESIQI